ncbi:hypothetical protein ES705_24735 [subsurface metagenome]
MIMFELISLKVNCPVCGESLMDEKTLVDNCPSYKLRIKIGEKEGIMNLSSVWESYNYLCDVETPEDAIIKIFCSHCNSEIISDAKCEVCKAPMIPLDLELGGKIDICSRVGCKNHFMKFVDLTFALKNLFSESELNGMPYYRDMTMSGHESDTALSHEEEKIEIIKSGTFLHAFCPHCKKTLIEKNMIKFKVAKGKESGFLMLSPYLNIFTSKSTIFLQEGKMIGEFKCFHCNTSLMVENQSCEECGSEIAKIAISARTKLIDFYICAKKGCRWHGLSKEDLNDIRLEDSLEW